jgi:hypothetical protein
MNLISWFKTLRAIVATHDAEMASLRRHMDHLDRLVRERTDIGVDAACHRSDRSHVIVVGRYRNRDYVQTYSVQPEDFIGLVEHLKAMETHGVVRYMDGPPMMKAVFERERAPQWATQGIKLPGDSAGEYQGLRPPPTTSSPRPPK